MEAIRHLVESQAAQGQAIAQLTTQMLAMRNELRTSMGLQLLEKDGSDSAQAAGSDSAQPGESDGVGGKAVGAVSLSRGANVSFGVEPAGSLEA